ncbi:MAG: polyprenyl diphosphate synthase [Candidatus Micrarchaeaceae archaeon]
MPIPYVIGLIPDGNRRWARKHRLSFAEAYDMGIQKFISFAEWCKDYGIKNITVWSFSTENFKRTAVERHMLFSLYQRVFSDRAIINRLHENKTRFKAIGEMWRLPKALQKTLNGVEKETRHYKDRVINMLIAYGGRDDILHAAKAAAEKYAELRRLRLSQNSLKSLMMSSNVPDIDLIIRTSGEERLSGFMPWQSAYSELYFSKKLWPDFTKQDLHNAVLEYGRRQRRFGR